MNLITFLLPVFHDARAVNAIQSIIERDTNGKSTILVIDGGENRDLTLCNALRDQDRYINGKDKGIFDALNKGLENVQTPFVGWIGADDTLQLDVEEICLEIAGSEASIFSFATLMTAPSGKVSRVFWPVRSQTLRKFGFHLPHFSTFARSSILKEHRFILDHGSVADIPFFLSLEERLSAKDYKIIKKTAVFMETGGTSNGSIRKLLLNNRKLFSVLSKSRGRLHASVFLSGKLLFKLLQVVAAKTQKTKQ